MTSEFGRTPPIGTSTGKNNSRDGRDHWAAVFSAAFVGGRDQGAGHRPVRPHRHLSREPVYTPADLAATVCQSLGIDPATEVRDRLDRPIRLCSGEPIAPLFTAARTA